MTTMILNRGFSTVTAVVNSINNFFDSVGKAVIMARGVEVNSKIAYDLQHEYPDMSVPAITAMLNDNLRKEVYGD